MLYRTWFISVAPTDRFFLPTYNPEMRGFRWVTLHILATGRERELQLTNNFHINFGAIIQFFLL